ncbi:SRP9/SRP21 family protein, partial [Aspergillus saccharolyticus JOP 1030-1]
MPYLPTPQSYLEQSALLLQAYPDARITTKYTFPSTSSKTHPTPSSQTSSSQPDAQAAPQDPKPRIATLTLKTFHPESGICLKYRTNKGAEVGRLISSLGKLAAGVDVEGLGLGVAATAVGGGDVEMGDAPA